MSCYCSGVSIIIINPITSKLLDCSELVSLPRNDILAALLRLSKSSRLYPECLTIMDLEQDDDVLPVNSGRFGEIYKGRSRNQAICLKVIKVNQKTQINHLLKVSLFGAYNNCKCLSSRRRLFLRRPYFGDICRTRTSSLSTEFII